MKNEIISVGKTVEEAFENAKSELGVDSLDNMDCKVMELPKKGLFGLGGTMAKVKVSSLQSGGGDNILGFVQTLLRDLDITAKAEQTQTEEGGTFIKITGTDAGMLIGHHGDTLDAFQYLANLAANKKSAGEQGGRVKVTIDIENYRGKREETLRVLARRMASKALKYKRSVMLEPMNPYERRIIHSEIQNIEGVSTNSIGTENNRKIVIYLTDKNNEKKAPFFGEDKARGKDHTGKAYATQGSEEEDT